VLAVSIALMMEVASTKRFKKENCNLVAVIYNGSSTADVM
jgi:hypothetical protein